MGLHFESEILMEQCFNPFTSKTFYLPKHLLVSIPVSLGKFKKRIEQILFIGKTVHCHGASFVAPIWYSLLMIYSTFIVHFINICYSSKSCRKSSAFGKALPTGRRTLLNPNPSFGKEDFKNR